MKKYLAITGCLLILIVSCKRENPIECRSVDKAEIIEKMNTYIPPMDAIERYKLVKSFNLAVKTLKSNLETKDAIVFEDKLASEASYEMETSLLNDSAYCYIWDTTLFYSGVVSSSFELTTVEIDSSRGEPIIDGDDMLDAYLDLEDAMSSLHNSDSSVIFIEIAITDFDENTTSFSVDYTVSTQGEFTHCGNDIIYENQDPSLFTYPTNFYWCKYTPSAPQLMEVKFNPNNPAPICECGPGFQEMPLIEGNLQEWYFSWSDSPQMKDIFWAGQSCGLSGNYQSLNTYMTKYKEDVIDAFRPTGGNIYFRNVEVGDFSSETGT